MELSPERLIAQLGSEPLRPAYLIAGPEPLRVLEAADAVRAQARAEGIAEREVFDADGRDFDWNRVAQSVNAMSLFASRRLLDVRLPSAKPGKEGSETILEFCAHPPQDVVLLITGDDWSGKQHGGKWSEAIAHVGHHAIAWALKPHELPDWVERRLRARGLRADRDAVQRLVERVEGNLLAAHQEIQKLGLLYPEGELGFEDIERAVLNVARYDVFKLTEAVLAGQHLRVQRMLDGLQAEGVSEVLVHYTLAEDIRALKRVKDAVSAGRPLPQVLREQRVWGQKERLFERVLPQLSPATLERLLQSAHQVDGIVKGMKLPNWPTDNWQALLRLALMLCKACSAR